MSDIDAEEGSGPTVLISQSVIEDSQAMVALREMIGERTGGQAFHPIVMLKSFAEIHEATMEYAHDEKLYQKQAAQEFAAATTHSSRIGLDLPEVSIIAITKAEWDDGVDAKWFLERYLYPVLADVSDRYVLTALWNENLMQWDF